MLEYYMKITFVNISVLTKHFLNMKITSHRNSQLYAYSSHLKHSLHGKIAII